MDFNALKCQHEDCGLILENPVTLVCGYNVCRHHLDGLETKFKCFFCHKQHSIPEEGFSVNRSFEIMIESFNQSQPLRKLIKIAFENLNQLINEYEKLNSDAFVYDYFSEIRNKVDLHREELVKEINERSEEIIQKLKLIEEEYKLNKSQLKSLISINE